jgi:branched-chain amino acid transport system ATP-binding protein
VTASVPALQLTHVSKTFGGLRAVSDVSFSVPEGSIFGLIGPNGAGKTTVFNLITGVYQPDRGGSIFFRGADLLVQKQNPLSVFPVLRRWRERLPLSASEIALLGIGRTFQNIRLFGQLTVLENVLVACENRRRAHLGSALLRTPLFFRDEEEMTARALELLEIFDLGTMADEMSTSLSYGNQRRLEIARAMMLGPKLLLLDEPAAGMNYGEAEGLKKQIRWLRDQFHITVVLVEHNMQVVMGVCEGIHVLDHGETIAHGSPEEVRKHPKVLAAYLGEETPEGDAPASPTGAATHGGDDEGDAVAPETAELS